MKDKADHSRGREKCELHQAYESYSDYAFPNNETRHPRCENEADYVLWTPTNDECQLTNWKCVMQKCTACNSIAPPGGGKDSYNWTPMITLNTYMTQFTCSHHGIIIHKIITTYLDAKVIYKNICFLCGQIIQSKTPDFTSGRLYERIKLVSIQRKIGDFHKDFYIQ